MNQPVAFLGPDWTYSHLAVQEFQPEVSLQFPCDTIDHVFATILSGKARCGLVPIHNTTSGLVSDTADSILRRLLGIDAVPDQVWWKRPLCISGSLSQSVSHCLVGWGTLSSVQTVVSKQQAMDQCQNWLAHHLPSAQRKAADSSAGALPGLKQATTVAAITSRQAANASGIPILASDIQDQQGNRTEFVVVQRDDLVGFTPYGRDPRYEYWVCEQSAGDGILDQPISWTGSLTFAGRPFRFYKIETRETFAPGSPVTQHCLEATSDSMVGNSLSSQQRAVSRAGQRWRLGVA